MKRAEYTPVVTLRTAKFAGALAALVLALAVIAPVSAASYESKTITANKLCTVSGWSDAYWAGGAGTGASLTAASGCYASIRDAQLFYDGQWHDRPNTGWQTYSLVIGRNPAEKARGTAGASHVLVYFQYATTYAER